MLGELVAGGPLCYCARTGVPVASGLPVIGIPSCRVHLEKPVSREVWHVIQTSQIAYLGQTLW